MIEHDPPEDEPADEEAGATEDPAFDEAGRDRIAQLSSVLGSQTTGRVVLEGVRGVYYEADPDVVHPKAVSVDARLAALGYEPLGGLLCRRFQRVLVQGYARPGGSAYALVLLPNVPHRAVELLTTFTDGSSLTTTTNDGPGDDPARRILRTRCPGLGVAELDARHRERVAALLAGGRIVRPTEASLEALAGAIDDFLVRYDG